MLKDRLMGPQNDIATRPIESKGESHVIVETYFTCVDSVLLNIGSSGSLRLDFNT